MKKIFITLLTVSVIVFNMVGLASALIIDGQQYLTNSSDHTYLDEANYQWSGDDRKTPGPGDSTWDPNYPNNPNSVADVQYVTGNNTFVGTQLYYHGQVVNADFDITNDISFTGPIYMIVKDGNHDPMWYIFNLAAWNGTDTLELRNFWPGQGNISHINIFGTAATEPPGPPVPEPVSMLLLGLGLVGVTGFRRMVK